MFMLLGMSKQLVYAFPGFYNKETISSNNLKTNFDSIRNSLLVFGLVVKEKKRNLFLRFWLIMFF